ncbi:DUF397 domain-containing protein [Streptomyces sp. NRRL WC-3742]|uniref:DUF397 domain-containing protein n=1 Tax=Streptomyces sp. NRRL WC-3742 TaxID=1463934 RepID=UPI0004C8CF0A|nr:DUF397 domain-containing protein [Streptomyces sp. NRRL WC-3742]
MTSTKWQKSSYSGSGGDCVEIRALDGAVELRESDEGDHIIRATPVAFTTLLAAAKASQLDHHA